MATILTPLEFTATATLERRLFRKKVLPIDSINYNGRTIDFTREYLEGIVEAFNNGAFDNVPLQFADANNSHTNDPDRYRGDVVGMSLEDDGLYVTVAATQKGAEILQENPKLGISARIVNGYDRADGKHFSAAMQHVLATHDPRIPGLGAWDTVESFSNDANGGIIDLTAEKFGVKNSDSKDDSVSEKDNSLSAEELTALRALLADLDNADADAETDADEAEDENAEELTDEELNALIAELDAESDPESEPVDPEANADQRELASAGAELSNSDSEALELANQTALELSRVKAELSEQRWKNERAMFIREYGITPAILDMAAPVLKSEGQTVELSNGEKTDSSAVMRQVLTEFGKMVKVLDLGNELGSGIEGEQDLNAEAAAKRDETTKALRAMMGN
jgi:hypothetical protein